MCDSFATLDTAVQGAVLLPGDTGYDEAARGYGGILAADAIVLAQSIDDVTAALTWANSERMPVLVRSGGHSHAHAEGALLLDVSALDGIALDGTTVTLGPGARWGDVADALAPHGLGLSSGDTESVGVGGLTLGGGIGWFVRGHGLALDNLVSCTVVTGEGRVVETSADREPELFWSVRGGGGATGVVVELVFAARPVPPLVTGTIMLTRDDPETAIRTWRDVSRAAGPRFNSTFFSMPSFGPEMPASAMVMLCWEGESVEEARAALAPILALPQVTGEEIAVGSYRALLGEAHPPEGMTIVDGTGMAPELTDAAITAIVAHSARTGDGMIMLRYVGGALNEVPAEATSFGHRDAEVMLVTVALLDAETPEAEVARVRGEWASLLPHAPSAYANFLNESGPAQSVRSYPAATLERLAAAKRRYDPAGILRTAHAVTAG